MGFLCIVAVPQLGVVASANAARLHGCRQQQHLLYLLQQTQRLELPNSALLQSTCKQHRLRLCQTAAKQTIDFEHSTIGLPQAYSKSPGLCSHYSGIFGQVVSGQQRLLLYSLISCRSLQNNGQLDASKGKALQALLNCCYVTCKSGSTVTHCHLRLSQTSCQVCV